MPGAIASSSSPGFVLCGKKEQEERKRGKRGRERGKRESLLVTATRYRARLCVIGTDDIYRCQSRPRARADPAREAVTSRPVPFRDNPVAGGPEHGNGSRESATRSSAKGRPGRPIVIKSNSAKHIGDNSLTLSSR